MSPHTLAVLLTLVGSSPSPCAVPGEPSLAILSRAALKTASLEPERVQSMLRRSRAAPFLPEVSVRVGRGAYASIRDADTLDPSIVTSDTFHWEVTARLSLDRWIFDQHELRAAESAGRLAEHRLRLLDRVSALWSERRGLDTDDPECEALSSLLDTLTGGALSRGKALPRPPPRR
jgi:hypothetical protein